MHSERQFQLAQVSNYSILLNWPPFFIVDLSKTLNYRGRFFANFSKIESISSLNNAYSCMKYQNFGQISRIRNIRGKNDLGAVGQWSFVFLVNFYAMADLSGRR